MFVAPQDTTDEVARKSAFHTAGKLVKMLPPGAALRLRVQGQTEFLPRGMKVEEARLKPMETIQILVEGAPEYESALKVMAARGPCVSASRASPAPGASRRLDDGL